MRHAFDTALLSIIGYINRVVFTVSRGRLVFYRIHGMPGARLTIKGPDAPLGEIVMVCYLRDGNDCIVLAAESETRLPIALRTATAAALFDQEVPVDVALLTKDAERGPVLKRVLGKASIYERHQVTKYHQVPIARLAPHDVPPASRGSGTFVQLS
ncbi:hypothetical protein [Spongiactinospora sp. 9N601]|uniref:hypothetical protein n=1 Tax=Spongiactinospora sp. 9N601 TaxID=3375149 RepID=UPI0037AB2800